MGKLKDQFKSVYMEKEAKLLFLSLIFLLFLPGVIKLLLVNFAEVEVNLWINAGCEALGFLFFLFFLSWAVNGSMNFHVVRQNFIAVLESGVWIVAAFLLFQFVEQIFEMAGVELGLNAPYIVLMVFEVLLYGFTTLLFLVDVKDIYGRLKFSNLLKSTVKHPFLMLLLGIVMTVTALITEIGITADSNVVKATVFELIALVVFFFLMQPLLFNVRHKDFIENVDGVEGEAPGNKVYFKSLGLALLTIIIFVALIAICSRWGRGNL